MTPTAKLKWRRAFASYCRTAETNRLRWDYTQARKYSGLGLPATGNHAGDCSSFGATATKWANLQTGLSVPDPLGANFNGTGNTGTALAFLRPHPVPRTGRFFVGDAAIFGTASKTVHVIWCRVNGDETTAIWTSHGHESSIFGRDAPEPVTLNVAARYQRLVGVYRNPGLL